MRYLKSICTLFVLIMFSAAVFAADLTITAENVVPSSGYGFTDGTAGEAITRGQTVYLKSSDNEFYKADCDNTAATATVKGIALQDAANGQPLRVQTSGSITIGATVTVGTIYVASDTAGGIKPHGDLASDDYVSIIGVGTTSAIITMLPSIGVYNSGVQVP